MKNSEHCAFANPGSDQGPGSSGLTKREYFAIECLKGILSNPAHNRNELMGVNAAGENGFIAANFAVKESLAYADEFLKQLES